MPKNTEATLPWERRVKESAKAFEAFRIYRDMGPDRSLVKVSERLGKSRTIITRWSSVNNWVERARAYDADLEREAQKQTRKEYSDMVKRHVQIAMQLQNSALLSLKELNKSGKPMRPRDIKEFIALGTELERINRMVPAEEEQIEDDGFLDAMNGIAAEVNVDAGDTPEDIDPEE